MDGYGIEKYFLENTTYDCLNYIENFAIIMIRLLCLL